MLVNVCANHLCMLFNLIYFYVYSFPTGGKIQELADAYFITE